MLGSLRIFDNPFSKYLVKELLECIGYILGYLPKLNVGLELVSVVHFQHIFSMKTFLVYYFTSSNDQFSISDLLYFSRY